MDDQETNCEELKRRIDRLQNIIDTTDDVIQRDFALKDIEMLKEQYRTDCNGGNKGYKILGAYDK